MTTTFNLSCEIDTTDASVPLDIAVLVDGQPIFDHCHVDGVIKVSHNLPEDEGDHELCFVMQNKQPEHTEINESGAIVHDARIVIRDIAFDEIKLGHMVTKLAVYRHNFNGTQDTTQEEFYGEMGCNGTVSLKFATPIYLWLLEHM